MKLPNGNSGKRFAHSWFCLLERTYLFNHGQHRACGKRRAVELGPRFAEIAASQRFFEFAKLSGDVAGIVSPFAVRPELERVNRREIEQQGNHIAHIAGAQRHQLENQQIFGRHNRGENIARFVNRTYGRVRRERVGLIGSHIPHSFNRDVDFNCRVANVFGCFDAFKLRQVMVVETHSLENSNQVRLIVTTDGKVNIMRESLAPCKSTHRQAADETRMNTKFVAESDQFSERIFQFVVNVHD